MKAETKFDVEYQPSEDEPFMNPRQLDYFRRKLLAWKASILAESRGTIEHMHPHRRLGNVVLTKGLSFVARRRLTGDRTCVERQATLRRRHRTSRRARPRTPARAEA